MFVNYWKKAWNGLIPDMRKNFIAHVIKEDKYWKIDVIFDELFDEQESHVLTITGDTSSDFNSD